MSLWVLFCCRGGEAGREGEFFFLRGEKVSIFHQVFLKKKLGGRNPFAFKRIDVIASSEMESIWFLK